MSSPPVTTTIEPSSDIETENTTHAVLFHTHEGVAPEGDREEKPSTVHAMGPLAGGASAAAMSTPPAPCASVWRAVDTRKEPPGTLSVNSQMFAPLAVETLYVCRNVGLSA